MVPSNLFNVASGHAAIGWIGLISPAGRRAPIEDLDPARALRQLARRARDGETAAFGELFERCRGRLLGVCRRMLPDGSLPDPEDAVSEVFLRARRALPSYDPERSFQAWLVGIASHYCIDQLRRRAREKRLFEDADLDEASLLAPGPSPLAALVWAERRAELTNAIDGLPDRYRLPIVLRYFAELDYTGIAEVLDIEPRHVGVLLTRARRQLRDALGGGREP